MKIRCIGDVHGHTFRYVRIAEQADYSVQVGDMGFHYAELNRLDPECHRVLPGNHDNYSSLDGTFVAFTPHFLGDYGVHSFPGFEFFYVRGGFSIDKEYRAPGIDWWPEEELTYDQLEACVEAYKIAQPATVITHECPAEIIPFVAGFSTWRGKPIPPSRTAQFLQKMFEAHRPERWLFGHHHRRWEGVVGGTRFRCLGELEPFDIEV